MTLNRTAYNPGSRTKSLVMRLSAIHDKGNTMETAIAAANQFGASTRNVAPASPQVANTTQPLRLGYFRTAYPPQLLHQNRYRVLKSCGTGTVTTAVFDSRPQDGHLNQ